MARSVLLQLLLLPAVLRATAVLPVDFYPVVDEHYADPAVAPAAPLAVALPSGYADEGYYAGYEDNAGRQGGGRYSNGGQQGGYYEDRGDKGSSGREAVVAYDRGLRNQHKKQNDQGYYGDSGAVQRAYDDGRTYQGGQKYGQQARNSAARGNKGGFKKGHTTSGFTNSYHKDESGKKSEFYDSSNDEGDNFAYKGQDETYGGHGANAYQGGHHDNLYRAGSQGKEGHYGGGHNVADTKGHNNDYGRQEYYDRRNDYGQKGAQHNAKQLGGYYDNGARHNNGGGSKGYYGGHTGAAAGATLGFHGPVAPYPYY